MPSLDIALQPDDTSQGSDWDIALPTGRSFGVELAECSATTFSEGLSRCRESNVFATLGSAPVSTTRVLSSRCDDSGPVFSFNDSRSGSGSDDSYIAQDSLNILDETSYSRRMHRNRPQCVDLQLAAEQVYFSDFESPLTPVSWTGSPDPETAGGHDDNVRVDHCHPDQFVSNRKHNVQGEIEALANMVLDGVGAGSIKLTDADDELHEPGLHLASPTPTAEFCIGPSCIQPNIKMMHNSSEMMQRRE